MYRLGTMLQGKVWARLLSTVSQPLSLYSTSRFSATSDLITATVTRCQTCHRLQKTQALSTSIPLFAGQHRNTKKKLIRKIVPKKNQRSSWPTVAIYPGMTVSQLAAVLDRDIDLIFESLFYIPNTDMYDEPNSVIDDFGIITAICEKTGYKWRKEVKKKAPIRKNKDITRKPPPDPAVCVKRPPVVTIMGHVDHGKTTLLDTLRQSKIVDQEFGGITQHIGAFSVRLAGGEQITFLDTPGHAAFSNMRARGAQVTDIVILIVAAEDGVMNQTMESFKYAQQAGVPVIVAINKIDKHEASVEQTKQMLLRNGIVLEEQGGDIQAVPISALKKINLDVLQEAVITLSEMLEIRADASASAEGTVIEAKTDPGKGRVATVIIQRGTLKKGACLVAGTAWGKVRNMYDDQSRIMAEATPGVAVEVSGWKVLPSAGDTLLQVASEAKAREVVTWREEEIIMLRQQEEQKLIEQKQEAHNREYQQLRQASLDKGHRTRKIYASMSRKEAIESHAGPQLSVILKGDVDGTVEAILDLFSSYNCEHCQLNILQHGVGHVSEQDIDMAASFSGIVYTFNVDTPTKIQQLAHEKGVTIHSHNVIYKLIDDLQSQLQERVPPAEQQQVVGEATVKQKFMITEDRQKVPVAGCRCLKGALQKDKLFKLVRDGEIIIEGQPLRSLKHFKEEVSAIQESQECGLMFADRTIEPEPGDLLICYEVAIIVPQIQWQLNF